MPFGSRLSIINDHQLSMTTKTEAVRPCPQVSSPFSFYTTKVVFVFLHQLLQRYTSFIIIAQFCQFWCISSAEAAMMLAVKPDSVVTGWTDLRNWNLFKPSAWMGFVCSLEVSNRLPAQIKCMEHMHAWCGPMAQLLGVNCHHAGPVKSGKVNYYLKFNEFITHKSF